MSIVIPCRNETEFIELFLAGVLSQEIPANKEAFEVLVAEGMSDDGTREKIQALASRDPRIRLIDNPERIVSTGLNRAIREASGDIIIRMDVHSEYALDYVARCVAALEQTGADNVGGPARTKASGYVQEAIRLAYRSPFSVGGARFHDENYEGYVDTVTYGCWKKRTLEEIGLFDEELVRNQDDELNLRITRRGGKIWQTPAIKSWYSPRNSIRSLFKQYSQYGYWKVRVIQKHRIPASFRHLVPGAFILFLLVLAVLSLVDLIFFKAMVGCIGLYVVASLIASIYTCSRPERIKFVPIMPVVFAVYHFGYGYGFLRGVIDFWLLKRKHAAAFAELSRAADK